MRKSDIFPAWGRILRGYRPFLSIEITKECPLRCPGCYAYEPEHLGGVSTLRQLSDYRGDALVNGVIALVRRHRPLHVSIVGGEPLVRHRELDALLPKLGDMGVETQVVTSAVRPIPAEWAALRHVRMAVSIDGLAPEHDRRRAPATYERILKHIAGHRLIVHCTVTRQQLARGDYLARFAEFWSGRDEVRKIWFSLFTPQEGQWSEERLRPEDRVEAVRQIERVRAEFPKVDMSDRALAGYLRPPDTPEDCIFARTTTCVSADLKTRITPCQFGGQPVCSECGCLASAGLAAIGRVGVPGLVSLSDIFALSRRVGEFFKREDPQAARSAAA